MSGVLADPASRASSGLKSYDVARWSGWAPEISLVHNVGGLGSLLQTTPAGASGPADVHAPPSNNPRLLFWTKGPLHDGVQARIDSEDHRLRPRKWQYTVLAPGCPSWWLSTVSDTDGVFHLHLDQELMIAFAEEERLTVSIRSTPLGDDPIIIHQAMWAFEALKEGSPSRLFWDTAAAAIGLRLLRSRDRSLPSPARGGLAPWQVKRAVAFIRDNLHRDVSLTELAGQVGLSPHHFCRAFKQSTGASPHTWLTQHRIERAQDIIAARPSAGLTEVALSVGFSSQSALGTAFRRVTGTTPSAWRRERLL